MSGKLYTRADEKYYADAIKVGFNTKVIEGTNIDKLSVENSFPWLDLNSQQSKDIDRFRIISL